MAIFGKTKSSGPLSCPYQKAKIGCVRKYVKKSKYAYYPFLLSAVARHSQLKNFSQMHFLGS